MEKEREDIYKYIISEKEKISKECPLVSLTLSVEEVMTILMALKDPGYDKGLEFGIQTGESIGYQKCEDEYKKHIYELHDWEPTGLLSDLSREINWDGNRYIIKLYRE